MADENVETPAEPVDPTPEKTPEEIAAEGKRVAVEAEVRRSEEDRGAAWTPKTRLGRMVRQGMITNMHDALASGLPIREPELVDVLLPDLADDVINVNMVQRMTDSGRRVRFAIMAVVGNRDGYVGLGTFKGKEVGPSIRKAIDNAKLNMIEITRGCGSWECGCGTPHTMPFEVIGKSGSTEITVKPAPRGVGLAVGDIAKKVLGLAGIKDAWGFARGQTRTTINAAQATFHALQLVSQARTSPGQLQRTKMLTGPAAGITPRQVPAAPAAAPAAAPGGAP